MYMCIVFRVMDWVRSLKGKVHVIKEREISTRVLELSTC